MAAEPTDDQLRAYLQAHPDAVPHRRRVHVRPRLPQSRAPRRRRSRATPRNCSAHCSAGGAAVDPAALGDATLLERVFAGRGAARRRRAVRRRLRGAARADCRSGSGRARSNRLTACTWCSSASAPKAACLPLDEVRDAVRRDWPNDAAPRGQRKFYQSLLALHGDDRGTRRGPLTRTAARTLDEPACACCSPCCCLCRGHARPRTRCARRISNCARPAPRPTTCSGRCPHGARPAARPLRRAAAGLQQRDRAARRVRRRRASSSAGASGAPAGWTARRSTSHGLAATTTDVLVRLERLDGTTQVARAHAGRPVVRRGGRAGRSCRSPSPTSRLGVEHILLGIDHLLFVLALLILVQGTQPAGRDHHRVHRRPQHHAGRRDARLPARAGRAGRGRASRSASCSSRPRSCTAATGSRASPRAGLDRGLHLRPAARLRFRGALREIGLPQTRHPAGAAVLQRRRRGRASCSSSRPCSPSIALARRIPATLPAWAWRVPPYAIGSVASFWLIERLMVLAA